MKSMVGWDWRWFHKKKILNHVGFVYVENMGNIPKMGSGIKMLR